MLYRSTKGDGKAVNFEQAILAGYAPDGGLYVPETQPFKACFIIYAPNMGFLSKTLPFFDLYIFLF